MPQPPPPGPGSAPPPPPPSPYTPVLPAHPAVVPPGPRPSPGIASAALVCGIVGLVVFFLVVVSVVALVLGLIAASHAKRAPGPGSALGRARAGWIMGAVGVAGFVALMVGAVLTDGFEPDEIAVHRLDVGDCVDLDEGPFDIVEELPLRECDEPHDAEVYAIDDVAIDSDEYPGDTALTAEVEERCTGSAFAEYVGVDYGRSSLEAFYLYPAEESWGPRRPQLHVHGRHRRRVAAPRPGRGQRRLTPLAGARDASVGRREVPRSALRSAW